MRLLFIRHGDPDYEKDSLTKQGWVEAECLAERISALDVKDFYVSPLGRAKDTASLTLKKMNREAKECEWLQEFPPRICRPDRKDRKSNVWDWLPQDFVEEERFYSKDLWMESPVLKEGHVEEQYRLVTTKFDELLKTYGYEREGNLYRVRKPNSDTIVFFCHFGVQGVILSHLMNLSPMALLQSTCAAPSSVTTVYTEERRKGIAQFRICAFGDTSHLYVRGEEPSFAARFCECYDNEDERHD